MIGLTTLVPSLGFAESVPTVVQARELFNEALKDQEAGQFTLALAKLQRVQSFRDTSPVRYQIAKCNEGSGRIAKARELYLRTVDGTQVPSAEDPAVASASRDDATRLASRVGYVRIDGPATQDAEQLVGVDDEEWAGAGLHEVDPGPHVLRVRSDSGKIREIPFAVTSMSTASVKLFATKAKADGTSSAIATTPARAVDSSGAATPWSYVALGGGAAFLGAGVLMLVVRENDIASVETTCPSDRCPASSRDDVESHRSRASTLGVLGVTATVVGAAGLAAGTGLLLFGPRTKSARSTRASFVPLPGGAQLVAGGSF